MKMFQVITLMIVPLYAIVTAYTYKAAKNCRQYRSSCMALFAAFGLSLFSMLAKCCFWLLNWAAQDLGSVFLSASASKSYFNTVLMLETLAVIVGVFATITLMRQLIKDSKEKR